jgi:hypothetical protein
VARNQYRIDALLGARAMRAAPLDVDVEEAPPAIMVPGRIANFPTAMPG